ncbi:MAG TPA: hypothetical protein VHS31_17060 [Tepidisphaeraceae bacterium]|jgi:hypothetical protein|nr:hypothetical protein [Tepidisphaeraceae bacterium]
MMRVSRTIFVASLILLCIVTAAIWIRSYTVADIWDIRLHGTKVIEIQTDAGYLIMQSADVPFASGRLTHDSLGAHPLPGIAHWSFLGFSFRTFQWRFLSATPVKIAVVPAWFILASVGVVIVGCILPRKKSKGRAFEVTEVVA